MEIRTVLCPIDFTPLSERAVCMAVAICQRFGARLVLEHNLDPRPPAFLSVSWMWTGDHGAADQEKARLGEERLREALERLPSNLAREAKLTRGPVDLGLLEVANRLRADLLVMGSHGWSSAEHHSLTEQILDEAPCPVLTVTQEGTDGSFLATAEGQRATVLVPVDLRSHSRTTVAHALELADTLPLSLRLLHVEEGPVESGDLEGDRRRLEALVPEERRASVEFHIRSGQRASEILRAAEELGARLILMGCHPKGAVERFFTGATARDILHRAPCPVWFEPTTSRAELHAAS
ncbi:MAG TPA: universal stress protein [Vicinamibacteria bacterium]|nr:universal stress protein [Vicinamibacteria bacterium]